MYFYQLISNKIEKADGACIALLGGGGKTALLHKLANEFAEYYLAVLQTSLTKTAFHSSDNPVILNDIDINNLATINHEKNPLFLIGEKISNEKLQGISEAELIQIRRQFDISIFECDGARNQPLKVHTEYDPKVPRFASHVIIIIGADVVDTKISDGFVHRPELFCKTWNVSPNFKLDIEFISQVTTSQKGYLSKVPNGVNIIYFVNKWDGYSSSAEELAKAIFRKIGKPTFYGSIQKNVLRKVFQL